MFWRDAKTRFASLLAQIGQGVLASLVIMRLSSSIPLRLYPTQVHRQTSILYLPPIAQKAVLFQVGLVSAYNGNETRG